MRSIIEGVFIALLGALAVWGALIVPPAPEGETWAGMVPMVVSVSLLVMGLWIAFPGFKKLAGSDHNFEWALDRKSLIVPGLLLLSIAYHQSILLFGYLLPTAVIAPILLGIFGVRNKWGLLASAILCPTFFHILFFELLGVFPPFGESFDLLNLIQE